LCKQFFQDQLYNPHGRHFLDLYRVVFAQTRWVVFGSFQLITRQHGVPVATALVRGPARLVGSLPYTYHGIPVLASWPRPFYDRTEGVRSRFFKVIRVRVCRHWLAHVRVLLCKICSPDVADCVAKELEAWFATVPHREVRWSDFDPERLRKPYKVCRY
jgi:hypothetical protein